MATFDIVGYLLPLAAGIIYWAILLLHKPAPVKNRFRTGQAEMLAEKIEVDTHLSRKQFVDTSPKNKRALRNVVIYGLIITGVYILYLKDYLPWLIANPGFIAVVLAPILGLVLLTTAGIYSSRVTAGQQYDLGMSVKENIHYTFTADYFEIKAAFSTIIGEWKTVDHFSELPDMIIIQAASVGIYIQKAKFKNNQLAVFTSFLRANFQEVKV
ncbi:MAG: hypothetical protein KA149_06390 [Chitinophagales bacterium]|nr:hypothetical protein [Chitinophagales bacterium]